MPATPCTVLRDRFSSPVTHGNADAVALGHGQARILQKRRTAEGECHVLQYEERNAHAPARLLVALGSFGKVLQAMQCLTFSPISRRLCTRP
jgi:hypothetical protein